MDYGKIIMIKRPKQLSQTCYQAPKQESFDTTIHFKSPETDKSILATKQFYNERRDHRLATKIYTESDTQKLCSNVSSDKSIALKTAR